MQFLLENYLNRCQIFGRSSFFKTDTETIFGYRHIPGY